MCKIFNILRRYDLSCFFYLTFLCVHLTNAFTVNSLQMGLNPN
jgi:hypothetical protein